MTLEVQMQRQLGQLEISARFHAEAGVTALFGRSGAGKTSLINMIAGLLRPDAGRLVVGDRVLFDREAGINVPPRARRIGYVFQEGRLFPHLSVSANLRYGERLTPAAARYADVAQVVEMLGLGELLKQRPAQLSGGERQRVAIGRALLTSPTLLLLDEPLASLDGARKQEILPYLERLRDELRLPIVYVSHQLDEVARLADSLVLMAHGKQLDAGPVLDVANRFDLGEFAGLEQAGTLLEAQVAHHHDSFELTQLSCAAGELLVPRIDLALGRRVRVRVRSADVTIATQRPTGLSVQNVLRARIVALTPQSDHSVRLRLLAGDAQLLASVTRKSVAELGLAPGREVFALIKSVALVRPLLD